MTRFARAHGSKASNERLPEAATSWNVMKQQLRDKVESSEALADSPIYTQKIWKSSDFVKDVWDKNEVKWADLEDSECASKAVKSCEEKFEKKSKKKKHSKTISNVHFTQTTGDNQKKRKKKNIHCAEFEDTHCTEIKLAMSDGNLSHSSNAEKIKKTKKKKKRANDELNNIIDIKLEKQTIIAANNTEHNVYLANKKKTKHRQRTDLATYEMLEDTICEENGTSTDFSIEDNVKKKLGKKRKRSHDRTSEIQGKQLVKKYRNGMKEKEKVNLEKCAALEAGEHQLKKKRKCSRNENTIEHSNGLNSVKQNFIEVDSETNAGADVDVVLSEKRRKKKKCKGNRGKNTVEDVETSLNGGKLNFHLESSETHKRLTSDLVQNEARENKTEDVWQQKNNRKFMKKQRFSVEDRKVKKGEFEKKFPHTTILHMNGKDIEIVKFDGFPLKKDDAENLWQLKKKMIASGIPSSEIKSTMKLERRKAEKALAREKKKVCFHCRNSGHVLSECPELGKADTNDPIGTGICFKCGSTEHKHFECRVSREQEFRYAKCFICNDQGHIARQCPDNPRGLYPKGGACHVCGDVTHLKKDCPDLVKEKEEKIIKLQTLSNKALEALEDDKNTKSVSPNHVNKKKTVKF